LLAWRKLASPDVALFLDDPAPHLVAEAARAVHDLPVTSAYPKLAALTRHPKQSESVLYRALNAHVHLGSAAHATALAEFAASGEAPEKLRGEAPRMLGDWAKPPGRDRVLGSWRPIAERSPEPAAAALRERLSTLFKAGDLVIKEAAVASGKLGVKEAGPLVVELIKDPNRTPATRVE